MTIPPLTQSRNVTPNSGFEDATISTIWSASSGTLTRSTAAPRSGVAHARITYATGGSFTLSQAPATGAPAAVGETWTVSAYIKGAGTVQAVIVERTAAGGSVNEAAGTAVVADGTWKRVTFTKTLTGATTGRVTIKVSVAGVAEGGAIDIDDIQLERGSVATPYGAGDSGTPGFLTVSSSHVGPLRAGKA